MTEELLRLKNTARVLDISRSTLLRKMTRIFQSQ